MRGVTDREARRVRMAARADSGGRGGESGAGVVCGGEQSAQFAQEWLEFEHSSGWVGVFAALH